MAKTKATKPAQEDSYPVVAIENVTLRFGGVTALDKVSLGVGKSELVALIGPNGAGKTSTLNVLSGFTKPTDGALRFAGQDITGTPPHRIASRGVARTFQGMHVFKHLSVIENIMLGRHIHMTSGLLKGMAYWPIGFREDILHRAAVERIIDFIELTAHRHVPAGALSYGVCKRIDLGRALAMDPKVLIMDEPFAGMNIEEKEDMVRFLLDIRVYFDIPILLVEHEMRIIMDIADRVVVLDWGRQIADGPPHMIKKNQKVIDAYLGA